MNEVVETTETPLYDSMHPMTQNNWRRQRKEGGIKRISLPRAKLQRSITLDPHNKVIKDINRKLKANSANRRKATLKADFVDLQKQEIALEADLEIAKETRKDVRADCEHVATVTRLEKIVKASEWKRLGQVTSVLGSLVDPELTPTDDDEIAEHEYAVMLARKLVALGRL